MRIYSKCNRKLLRPHKYIHIYLKNFACRLHYRSFVSYKNKFRRITISPYDLYCQKYAENHENIIWGNSRRITDFLAYFIRNVMKLKRIPEVIYNLISIE